MYVSMLEGDEQVGLLMVDGKLRSGTGVMAAGVFVQQVIPGSPADLDGRYACMHVYICIYMHVYIHMHVYCVDGFRLHAGTYKCSQFGFCLELVTIWLIIRMA